MAHPKFAALSLLVCLLTAPCLARDLKPLSTSIAAVKSRALKATTSVGLRNHEEPYDAAHYDDLADPAPGRGGNNDNVDDTIDNVWDLVKCLIDTIEGAADVALIGKKILFPWIANDVIIEKVDYEEDDCDDDCCGEDCDYCDGDDCDGNSIENNVAVNVDVQARRANHAAADEAKKGN